MRQSTPGILFFLLAAFQTQLAGAASSLDSYIAPVGEFSFPFFKSENPHASSPSTAMPRVGFRFEAGRLSEHISLDIRFSSLSSYTDYGMQFRLFDCFGYDATIKLCYGAGFGVMYSSGLITESTGRNFYDVQPFNPYLRFIIDTKAHVGVIVEAGVATTIARSYNSESPVKDDNRAKSRAYLAAGLIFDWERVDDPFEFNFNKEEETKFKAFQFGVKGGLPNTKFRSKDANGASSSDGLYRAGLVGGISLDMGSGPFGFEADAFYANRRYGFSETSTASDQRIEIIPQLRYRNSGATFLQTNLGGFFTIPISKTIISSYTSKTTTESDQPVDYGLTVGFGFGTRSRLLTLTFETRIGYGLANLLANPQQKQSTRSRYIDLLVGFVF